VFYNVILILVKLYALVGLNCSDWIPFR